MPLVILRREARSPAVFAAVLGLCYGLGRLAVWLGGGPETPVVWPAAGLALVAMLGLGSSVWPAVFLGTFLVYLEVIGQVVPPAIIAFGSVFEAVIGAALIDRLAGGANVFKRADTVFRFLAIVALVTTPAGATVAACARLVSGAASWMDVGWVWIVSWLGHLAGTVVVAPVLAFWFIGPAERKRWLEVAESTVVIGIVAVVSMVVFGGQLPNGLRNYPLEFMCMPVLLWAAVRTGRRETATAVLVLSGIAIWGTRSGFGPFARNSADAAVLLVQAFASVTAITGLVLAAALAEFRDAERQLRELATTDPLTGIANYRRLIDVLRAEIARSNRTGRTFAVIFLDMNGLKRINDKLGHLAGSRALTRLAETLRTSVRAIDVPARFGGDEFAVVLPETSEEGGRVVLRRITDRLAADSTKPTVSVSGGVAVFPRDGDSPTLLLRAADKLLYEAKSHAEAARKGAASGAGGVSRTGTLF